MSDARKTVLNEGVEGPNRTRKIDNSTITYDKTKTGGSAQVGKAVKLSADDTVALTTDGSEVLGELLLVEPDGFCTTRERGPCQAAKGNGASVTLGKKVVGALDADGNGGCVREVATGTPAELGKARGYITNNDDATAIVFEL